VHSSAYVLPTSQSLCQADDREEATAKAVEVVAAIRLDARLHLEELSRVQIAARKTTAALAPVNGARSRQPSPKAVRADAKVHLRVLVLIEVFVHRMDPDGSISLTDAYCKAATTWLSTYDELRTVAKKTALPTTHQMCMSYIKRYVDVVRDVRLE
jgi:hypothetical protein